MKYIAIFALVAAIVSAEKYAIIYGTKDNWHNYSIQADPCRQYALLRDAGFPKENIIMMAYTSVIKASQNPFPGMIFTDPAETTDGDWAKSGCFENVDYTDDEINKEVFLALLAGDKEAVKKATGRDDVRVFESGPEDLLFMYFIDHGNDNIVAVGDGVVTSQQVLDALQDLHDNKRYKKLVWYMEACHSGSMFLRLKEDLNIYVMTSSDEQHNAYMTNCPPNDKVAGKSMNTCIAGLWDNYYMEEYTKDAEATIGDIFDRVHERVAEDNPQNVSEFGDKTMRAEKLADYVGIPKTTKYVAPKETTNVDVYDVPRHLAMWKAIRADKKDLAAAMKEVVAESTRMAREEVEGMRLARMVMDEKAANKAAKLVSEVYETECYETLAIELIEKCGHQVPLNHNVVNLLRAICLPGLRAPNVDFSDVCL